MGAASTTWSEGPGLNLTFFFSVKTEGAAGTVFALLPRRPHRLFNEKHIKHIKPLNFYTYGSPSHCSRAYRC